MIAMRPLTAVATNNRKSQHEISSDQTSDTAHRAVSHDHLPPRARRPISKAAATQQALRGLARHGRCSMGRVATCQPVEGNTGADVWSGWCGLRLAHRISRGLVRDRRSPPLAGCRQGVRFFHWDENKGLPRLRRYNPERDPACGRAQAGRRNGITFAPVRSPSR